MWVSMFCGPCRSVVAAGFASSALTWLAAPTERTPSAIGVAPASSEMVSRRFGFIASLPSLDRDPFDVRQTPSLVEHRLLRAIETKQHLELPAGSGRHPVALLAGRGLRGEPDIDRTIRIRLQAGALR